MQENEKSKVFLQINTRRHSYRIKIQVIFCGKKETELLILDLLNTRKTLIKSQNHAKVIILGTESCAYVRVLNNSDKLGFEYDVNEIVK